MQDPNIEAPVIKDTVELDEKSEVALKKFQTLMSDSNIAPEQIAAYIRMVQDLDLLPEQLETLSIEDIQAVWQRKEDELNERKEQARRELEVLKKERRGHSAEMVIEDEADLSSDKWLKLNRDLNIMAQQNARQQVQELMQEAQKEEPELYLNRAQRRARKYGHRRG